MTAKAGQMCGASGWSEMPRTPSGIVAKHRLAALHAFAQRKDPVSATARQPRVH